MDFKLTAGQGIPHLVIAPLQATGLVVAAFSTRLGGNSLGPYASLNLAFHVGDQEPRVLANRSGFFEVLEIDPMRIVAAEQVHGSCVAAVGEPDTGQGAIGYASALTSTDGLITSTRAVPLTIYCADCVPVYLVDPVRPAIGLAHAGWKGTVQQVGRKTLQLMTELYGTDPADCLAAIGPSIGPCCYEVDAVVIERLKSAFPFWRELVDEEARGRWHLDLWEANIRSLVGAGIPRGSIFSSRTCTSCCHDLYFSYRSDGGVTGRMAAVLMLK